MSNGATRKYYIQRRQQHFSDRPSRWHITNGYVVTAGVRRAYCGFDIADSEARAQESRPGMICKRCELAERSAVGATGGHDES
jgi:hypothetical protein